MFGNVGVLGKMENGQVAGIDYNYVDAGEDNGDFFVYSSWQFGEGDISNAFDSIGLP